LVYVLAAGRIAVNNKLALLILKSSTISRAVAYYTLLEVRNLLWEYAPSGADGLKVALADATTAQKNYWLGKLNQVCDRLMNMGTWSDCWVTVPAMPIYNGFITLPRRFNTCAGVNLCCGPRPIYSRFWKFTYAERTRSYTNAVIPTSDTAQTFLDPSGTFYLRIKSSTSGDNGKLLSFIGGYDANSAELFSTATLTITSGSPATTSQSYTSLPRISKALTTGQVDLYSVDTTTAVETLIATYAPWETDPSYKRYEIVRQVEAPSADDPTTAECLCNLSYVPAVLDSDLIIPGVLGGLKHGLKALTYEDTSDDRQDQEWQRAVKALDDARDSKEGVTIPTFRFSPDFGAGSILNPI
jgi:hypothetical protein